MGILRARALKRTSPSVTLLRALEPRRIACTLIAAASKTASESTAPAGMMPFFTACDAAKHQSVERASISQVETTTTVTTSYIPAAIIAPLGTASVATSATLVASTLTAYPIPSTTLEATARAPAHFPSGRCTLGDGGLAGCGAAQDGLHLCRRRIRRGIGVGVTGRHQDVSWPRAQSARLLPNKRVTNSQRSGISTQMR